MSDLSQIPQDDRGSGDDWTTTYGDMVSLLLCFFILLFSMSTIDPAKFEMTTAALTEKISGEKPVMPIAEVIKELNDAVTRAGLEREIAISSDGAGVVIEFASSLLFESAKAELNPRGGPILKETVKTLLNEKYIKYGVEIEGHTDDVPIHTVSYPSNWELSGARAATVIKLFVDEGIDIQRLKATGYAYTQPKLPNRDGNGVAILENQTSNRRIVIRLYPMTYRIMSKELRAEINRLNTTRESKTSANGLPEPSAEAPEKIDDNSADLPAKNTGGTDSHLEQPPKSKETIKQEAIKKQPKKSVPPKGLKKKKKGTKQAKK